MNSSPCYKQLIHSYYEEILFVLTETSTAEQTWQRQVVIKKSRPFRALQLQVKLGEKKRERE
jgi:hypothetical protein